MINNIEGTIADIPVLKNNDQRKEFIEDYENWPLWIDSEKTKEKYYKLDIPNSGNSIVVRISLSHSIIGWNSEKGEFDISEKEEWGSEEYFLLKPGRYFRDCSTNKSALVEFLKDLQRG